MQTIITDTCLTNVHEFQKNRCRLHAGRCGSHPCSRLGPECRQSPRMARRRPTVRRHKLPALRPQRPRADRARHPAHEASGLQGGAHGRPVVGCIRARRRKVRLPALRLDHGQDACRRPESHHGHPGPARAGVAAQEVPGRRHHRPARRATRSRRTLHGRHQRSRLPPAAGAPGRYHDKTLRQASGAVRHRLQQRERQRHGVVLGGRPPALHRLAQAQVRHRRGLEQGLGHAALVAPPEHLGRGAPAVYRRPWSLRALPRHAALLVGPDR